jgi:predicted metal-binding membrane protein
MTVELRARRRDPAVLLWAVTAACWAGTLSLVFVGGSRYASHDQIVEHSTLPWVARIVFFLALWAVMIGAMMLPTTVLMARLVTVVSARAPHPSRLRAVLAGSYLAVWLAFGLVALVGDTGIHATVNHWPWLDEHSGLIKAGLLGLAGAVQFSPLKDGCLTACRDPMSMLWQHYGRRARQVWRLGWTHALNCLGCCWALMLVMFGVGVGSLAWMLVLTAVMVAEKTTRRGARLVTPVGVVLLVAAALTALAALGVAPFAPTLSTGLD